MRLSDPVQYLHGVGPLRAQLLNRLGIHRAVDLLFLFPRSYEKTAALRSGSTFAENERVSCIGTIRELDQRVTQSGKHMLGAVAELEGGGFARLLWYNQAYRLNELRVGQRVLATGTVRSTVLNWEIIQPQLVQLEPNEVPESQKPLPVYPLTDGLKQSAMRKMLATALPALVELIDEVLPDNLCEELDLLSIHEALRQIHWPSDMASAERARRRFIVQELLVLQLAIAMQRQQREQKAIALRCAASAKIHSRILNRLGFTLTTDQTQAIADVGRDMDRATPMNRLLQGDVGTGKTLVAQYAMLLCVAHGYQAALMAPTEVLARQHDRTLRKSLASSRVRIGLLIGSQTRAQRKLLLGEIGRGEIDLVIGTQALLSDKLEFKHLALVIVDEQHRFGVEQRARLRHDESQPHYLVLSATPIPRTIAMTAFGDLDVSVIRDRPPGQAGVHTYLGDRVTQNSWWRFCDEQIAKGQQAFVIAPRVSDDGDDDLATTESALQLLREGPFAHRKIGLLHGRLDGQQKEKVLVDFSSGDIDVLIATTVVEVGIDVPNATVMTILDADRLGLAQLHQLRGRVSRGRNPGFVCAFPSSGCDAQNSARLKAFENTSDGFELAELDLRMRGSGELLGTQQHGLSSLRVADLATDAEALVQVRPVAQRLVKQFPGLIEPSLERLRKQVLGRYAKSLGLSDVG